MKQNIYKQTNKQKKKREDLTELTPVCFTPIITLLCRLSLSFFPFDLLRLSDRKRKRRATKREREREKERDRERKRGERERERKRKKERERKRERKRVKERGGRIEKNRLHG